MPTLCSFQSKNQINAQGAVTENPGMPKGAMTRIEGDLFEEYVPQTKTSEPEVEYRIQESADDPIIQVILGEEFERELLHDSGDNRATSAETEPVLLEAVRGVGLGTESLVTNVQELTSMAGELVQRIQTTFEEIDKVGERSGVNERPAGEILDVARDAKYYARRNYTYYCLQITNYNDFGMFDMYEWMLYLKWLGYVLPLCIKYVM